MEQETHEPSDYIAQVMARVAQSGLSAAKICRRAGIAESTLRRIRSGEMSPTISTMLKIEMALKQKE